MNQQVRFITLGCRVNQYETQSMRESLEGVGLKDVSDSGKLSGGDTKTLQQTPVDFVVINTCTVTHAADRENRYWIRRARREHPDAKIIVTGCYVEKDREVVESIPGVDLVIGNQEKDDIASWVTEGCASPEYQEEEVKRTRKHRFSNLSVSRSQGKSRAYIKVQDGCNHACSFCKVVMVRGRSRSRELAGIVEEAKRLSDSGYKEVVLAGIQLGAYGLELDSSYGLYEAIEACANVPGIERVRLSSIEPTDVNEGVIRALKEIPQTCAHLHIPLQSGDTEVLKGMNRRYEREFYIDLIHRLKSEVQDFSLTLDVMAGFAGETEEQFNNTVNLLTKVEPLKCHVFPYSRREGTRAASLKDLPPQVVKERVRRLMALEDQLGRKVSMPYVGRTMPVLVENRKGDSMLMQGITENFMRVYFQGNEELIGKIVPVQFLSLQGRTFLGKMIDESRV